MHEWVFRVYFGNRKLQCEYYPTSTRTVAIFAKLLGYSYVSSWPSVVAERDLELAAAGRRLTGISSLASTTLEVSFMRAEHFTIALIFRGGQCWRGRRGRPMQAAGCQETCKQMTSPRRAVAGLLYMLFRLCPPSPPPPPPNYLLVLVPTLNGSCSRHYTSTYLQYLL